LNESNIYRFRLYTHSVISSSRLIRQRTNENAGGASLRRCEQAIAVSDAACHDGSDLCRCIKLRNQRFIFANHVLIVMLIHHLYLLAGIIHGCPFCEKQLQAIGLQLLSSLFTTDVHE